MRTLIPAVVAGTLLGLLLAPSAAADPTLPGMAAYATLRHDGVDLTWTSGGHVDGYEVLRSRAGGAFTLVATVGPTQSAYLDVNGWVTDIYLLHGMVDGHASVSSNPAPVLPPLFCPFVDLTLSPPWLNWDCAPCPITMTCQTPIVRAA